MTNKRSADSEIAPALRWGDADALDRALDRHYDALVHAASTFTGRDRAFAEDAAQDAMLRLVKKLPRFADDEHLRAWLFMAVRSCCIDRLRSEVRRRAREQRADGSERGPPLDEETLEHLRRSVGLLGETERAVLAQRFARDRTLSEIGDSLGLSREAVKGRLSRTLTRLSGVFRSAT